MEITMDKRIKMGEGIFEKIKKKFSTHETVELVLPTDVYKRADLMCMYIQEETSCQFDVLSLLELLYCDFMKYAIKKYNPERVLKEAMRKPRVVKNDDLLVKMDGKEYKVSRGKKNTFSEFEVKIPKREYIKGQLILDELEALYGYKIPFEVMLSNLIVNFIEDYKEGINKRAYTSIVKILRNVMND